MIGCIEHDSLHEVVIIIVYEAICDDLLLYATRRRINVSSRP